MLDAVVITAAGIIAGAINSIAGGGTLISFPALLWIGRDPIIANATNAVALWPGSLAGMVGFRRELASVPRWLFFLIIPTCVGTTIGALLLLRTPVPTFDRIVPFLILGATVLLAAQDLITRRLGFVARAHANPTPLWATGVFLFQFGVGIYGGYFGAGMGILMLAALGLIGLTDIHQMNGLKNLLSICINALAAVYFTIAGVIVWRDVLIMSAGAILGGFFGARMAHRLGRKFVQRAVVVIGMVMSVSLFFR